MADLDLDSMLDDTPLDDAPKESTLDSLLEDAADEVLNKPPPPGPSVGKGKGKPRKRTAAATLHGALEALPPDLKAQWVAQIQADTRTQSQMPRQEVLSRAYRSFFSREQKELMQKEGEDESQHINIGHEILKETFHKAMAKYPNTRNVSMPKGAVLQKMEELYLKQIASEAKARFLNSPDFDPTKFPNANAKIISL
mmetsp:Transcript_28135/g.36867  ORF Transcript_28135/g.36867 Transcript_28135/m.36867 type:complete len:197 (-) Transcript_28135:302-892(-)|eukprot:CAMPEP_0117762038 /NCGR_PEP_ID=MMETSP0947-20121206/17666_1 /TAXON_ID=44440 /ORGANISM="Chattonella subsalsa, Strain CCMP2191" /LENGTH=196 /DNA_ID=CAMNT_0005583201 /DNA_START=90 /DNA_END=680 /DNA_ORIENTATION=-